MKNEREPAAIEPCVSFLQDTLRNDAIRQQILRNGRSRDAALNAIKEALDEFDPKETELLVKTFLENFANDAIWNQNQRDFALEIFPLIDLGRVNGKKLTQYYLSSLAQLSPTADVNGEIDALLQVGKMITPHMDTPGASVRTAFTKLAKRFEGDERKYFDDNTEDLLARIPNAPSVQSAPLEDLGSVETTKTNIINLRGQGLSNPAIVIQLNLTPGSLGYRITKLIASGEIERRTVGRRNGRHDNTSNNISYL